MNRQHRRLSRGFAVAALGVALAAAGCGSSDDETSSTPTTSKTAAAGAKTTLELAADPGGALKFDKTKLEAKAGTVTLVMANPSKLPHGIGVDGNGVDEDGPTVPGGDTSKVKAELKPGTYEFYCTVASHHKAGMEGTLTVK